MADRRLVRRDESGLGGTVPDRLSSSGRAQTIDDACDAVAPAFIRGRSATRDDLLWTAMNDWASAATVALLVDLPDRAFRSVDEVRGILSSSTPTDTGP